MYTGECCSPVGIVHVLLSDFVRLGVHIDRVLRLGGHELGPDDAALLTDLFKIFTLIIPIIPIRFSFIPQIQAASLNAKLIQQKVDFLLHIPFPGKKESGPSQQDP